MLPQRRWIWKSTLPLAAALIAVSIAPMMATTVSTVPLIDIATGAPLGAGSTSTIIREPGGVTINVHTDIGPGTYTVWLVICNDPTRCINVGPPNCLPPPAGGPNIPDSVVFGSGQVVPSSEQGDFAARLAVGDTSRVTGGRERAGLTNAMGAEIRVVLRSHGPVLADGLESQITTFGGGCDVNPCEELQAGVHAPGAPTAETIRLDRMLRLLSRVSSRLGLYP